MAQVLIIGGGPAGLAAALALARTVIPALVIDSHSYRNAGITHMHTVASRDHTDPAVFRDTGREQIISRYPHVRFFDTTIVRAARKRIGSYDGFELTDDKGEVYTGKKLVLATGSRDVFPAIEGYAENWPSHIYQCLGCDGYEQRGTPNGVMDCGPMTGHLVGMALRFDERVTVLTNGPVPDEEKVREQMRVCEAWGAKIESRRVKRLVNNGPTHKEGVTVEFEEGENMTLGFIAHKPPTVNRAPELVEQLGLECVSEKEGGHVKIVNPVFNSTSVKGVFVAGDTMTPWKQVTFAMAEGMKAAIGASFELAGETEAATLKALDTKLAGASTTA